MHPIQLQLLLFFVRNCLIEAQMFDPYLGSIYDMNSLYGAYNPYFYPYGSPLGFGHAHGQSLAYGTGGFGTAPNALFSPLFNNPFSGIGQMGGGAGLLPVELPMSPSSLTPSLGGQTTNTVPLMNPFASLLSAFGGNNGGQPMQQQQPNPFQQQMSNFASNNNVGNSAPFGGSGGRHFRTSSSRFGGNGGPRRDLDRSGDGCTAGGFLLGNNCPGTE